jgi:hypothetical protein
MRNAIRGFLLLLLLPALALAAGSKPAYTPTPADVEQVDHATGEYFLALAKRQDEQAYALLTPGLQKRVSRAQWAKIQANARKELGEIYKRTRTRLNWYLDPPKSEGPGVYVAMQFGGNSEKASEIDDYLMWYRPRGANAFRLMRHEISPVIRTPKDAAAAKARAKLSTSPVIDPTLGFDTVAAARASLTARKDVVLKPSDDGWLVVVETEPPAVWSFAPPGHPAYPAVFRRSVVEKDGHLLITTKTLCEAARAPCERLLHEFEELNRKAAEGKP